MRVFPRTACLEIYNALSASRSSATRSLGDEQERDTLVRSRLSISVAVGSVPWRSTRPTAFSAARQDLRHGRARSRFPSAKRLSAGSSTWSATPSTIVARSRSRNGFRFTAQPPGVRTICLPRQSFSRPGSRSWTFFARWFVAVKPGLFRRRRCRQNSHHSGADCPPGPFPQRLFLLRRCRRAHP